MENFYEFVRMNPGMKKMEFENLLLVEYKCPIEAEVLPVWTPHDAFVYCLSGEKTWRTHDSTVTLKKDECLFVKKGAQIVYQSFEEEFCLMIIFIKDNFKQALRDQHWTETHHLDTAPTYLTLHPVKSNPTLHVYCQSILSLLQLGQAPSPKLMEVKLLELIHLLGQLAGNEPLIQYLLDDLSTAEQKLRQVMMDNFMYNLQLEDYANLCNRSLSSFKRDFQKSFQTTPGKWLMKKRLERAALLLKNTKESITQIAFACGFEDSSHFSRVFKKNYHNTPLGYRKL